MLLRAGPIVLLSTLLTLRRPHWIIEYAQSHPQ